MAQSPRRPSPTPQLLRDRAGALALNSGRGDAFTLGREGPSRAEASELPGGLVCVGVAGPHLGRLLSLAPLPQCLCLPLGLAGQTFHLFFVLPPLPGAALHSPGHRPCWVEPLRARVSPYIPTRPTTSSPQHRALTARHFPSALWADFSLALLLEAWGLLELLLILFRARRETEQFLKHSSSGPASTSPSL